MTDIIDINVEDTSQDWINEQINDKLFKDTGLVKSQLGINGFDWDNDDENDDDEHESYITHNNKYTEIPEIIFGVSISFIIYIIMKNIKYIINALYNYKHTKQKMSSLSLTINDLNNEISHLKFIINDLKSENKRLSNENIQLRNSKLNFINNTSKALHDSKVQIYDLNRRLDAYEKYNIESFNALFIDEREQDLYFN